MRHRLAGFVCLLFLASAPAPAPGTLELPPPLAKLLATGRWDATPTGFRIITLSHLADGCAAQGVAHPVRKREALACVDRALALADRTRPAASLDAVGDGLWLSHYALVLGARDELAPCAEPERHERVARRLSGMSLGDPLRHAPSYANLAARWPADQSVTLAALHRFDVAHGARLVAAPLAAWRDVLERKGLDPTSGLPVSDLSGTMPGAKHPRGCAQSFISRYLAEVDPALSASWWKTYRERFLVRVGGVAGFREWPPGVERKGDVDSGPIVLGIGTAASALAIAAARAQGDDGLAAQLEGSAALAGALNAGQGAEQLVLALAILFQARWQPRLVPAGSLAAVSGAARAQLVGAELGAEARLQDSTSLWSDTRRVTDQPLNAQPLRGAEEKRNTGSTTLKRQ